MLAERHDAVAYLLRSCRADEPRYWMALGDAYAVPQGPWQGQPGGGAPISLDQASKTYAQAIRWRFENGIDASSLPRELGVVRLADVVWVAARTDTAPE